MRIGIAGLGGIGSNIAWSLLRTGKVSSFLLVDFDKVCKDNLNRQFYFENQLGLKKTEALRENLYKINKDIKIETLDKKIQYEDLPYLFHECDIVIEGLDDERAKKFFLEGMSTFPGKIIAASGIAGLSEKEVKTKTLGNVIICGDFTTPLEEGVFSPKVTHVASLMAVKTLEIHEALK